MELRDYLRVLRRRWLLILGTAAVVTGLAAAYSVNLTPRYASDAKVVVTAAYSKGSSASDSAYTTSLAATARVQTYSSLVADGKLAQRVVDSLGLQTTAKRLSKHLHAEVVPDTSVLELRVTDESPSVAQQICTEVVRQLLRLIKEIETPVGQRTALFRGTEVSGPSYETDPVSPKPLRNVAIGLVLGLLAGLAIAVARELLDSSLKTGDEVEDVLDAPVLGGIAYDAGTAKLPLVSDLSSHAPRVEAFRVLRTNLQFVDIDAEDKIFVVTSSVPGEGKSTTAVNVAITMAQAGQRVLLVDGDLRRPQVAAMLGLENVVGVTTVLLGRLPLADAVQTHASGLQVLASGAVPPNPAELLQSRAMGELIEVLRAEFDVVVIDSPPLLPVTDAALLARQTDGAVIVVRHGHTKRDQLAGAEARLRAVDARVLGAVFNRVRARRGGGYGYGSGDSYGYAPEPGRVEDVVASTAAADLRPDTAPRRTPEVAEVLPIGTARAPRSGDRIEPVGGSRRAPGPAISDPADLEGTGTAGVPRPGRHRS